MKLSEEIEDFVRWYFFTKRDIKFPEGGIEIWEDVVDRKAER